MALENGGDSVALPAMDEGRDVWRAAPSRLGCELSACLLVGGIGVPGGSVPVVMVEYVSAWVASMELGSCARLVEGGGAVWAARVCKAGTPRVPKRGQQADTAVMLTHCAVLHSANPSPG